MRAGPLAFWQRPPWPYRMVGGARIMRHFVLILALCSCSPAPAPSASARTGPSPAVSPSAAPKQPAEAPDNGPAVSTLEVRDDMTAAQAFELMNDAWQQDGVVRVSQGNRTSQVLGPPADLTSGS